MNPMKRIFTLVLALVLCIGCLIIPASAAGNVMYGIGFVNTYAVTLAGKQR